MKESLQRRILKRIESEQEHQVDMVLLNKLREIASRDTTYWDLTPEKGNTLNEFFREIKELMLNELLLGNYGSEVIIDTIIVLCFEVGYGLKEWETLTE